MVNYSAAIQYLYPDAKPNIDYVIVAENEVQEILHWGLDVPPPTQRELRDAWEAYLANPPVEPPTPSEELQGVKMQLASVLKVNAEKEIELQTLKQQNALILVDNANKSVDLANVKQQTAEIMKMLAENNIIGGHA